jgi:tetratricopeptide (TPR) repeat protein
MASRRRALTAAGAIAIVAAGTPRLSLAQRNQQQQPGADATRMLIATFRAPANSPSLGVEVADALRTRVQQENSARTLWVLPRTDINNYLTSSGYKADSALSVSDLKELAKLMRADEIVDGTAARTSNGIHVEARLILARDVSLAQPLAPVDARDAGSAAKAIEKSLADARRQLPDYRKCESALRDQKYTDAAVAARTSISKSPGNSHLSRLCLLSAFYYGKTGSDSVIRAAEEVLKADSLNRIALGIAQEAYEAKGDTAKSIQTLVRIGRIDPSVRQAVIQKLGAMNRPDIALPIVTEMLQDNPGDPQLLRVRFLLLATARQYKPALQAADEWMKADTAAANADLFGRMVAIAAADSQPQLASQIAARAVQKYPNKADIQFLYAQTLRKAGQLQQSLVPAQRALELNPKIENGIAFVLVTYNELKQPDSAFAWAKRAVAAGADKEAVGQGLLGIVGAAVKEAQAAQNAPENSPEAAVKRQAWLKAFHYASTVDSIAPSQNSAFFMGVSSFQAGLDALQSINKSRKCEDAQLAEDMWAASQMAITRGARTDANTAGQIMSAIQQYSPNIAQAKKAVCKGSTSRSGNARQH